MNEEKALVLMLDETIDDINAVGSPALRLGALKTLRKVVQAFNIALIEDMSYDPMNP